VRPDVAERLLDLNRRFYQTFAAAFASKRGRVQPGAARILSRVGPEDSVLDLGCGHGMTAAFVAESGHRGRYVGLDASPDLLDLARRQKHPSAVFASANLAEAGWDQALDSVSPAPFDWVLALAVLHHLPGEPLRRSVVEKARRWVAADGTMVVSAWDFLASPAWRRRVVPWDQLGIDPEGVDPDDFVLDWREGGRGFRYIHRFTSESLAELALASGFSVEDAFRSDGQAGRLGLYQVWRAAE
jgi:SAM-dependent methyltransferase